MRAPLFAADSNDDKVSSGDSDIDIWLNTRARTLRQAQVSLESTHQSMIRAHKGSEKCHVYVAGDMVKFSTKVLPLRMMSTQQPKLLPKYVEAFEVLSISGSVVQVKLPDTYRHVHDKFNVVDMRPWLHADCDLDIAYPAVAPHPALNPIVQLLDRKRYGRVKKHIGSLLDIPCQYFAVRKDGSQEWLRASAHTEPADVQLMKEFEKRYPRSDRLPCDSLKAYGPEKVAQEDEGISDDELPIGWFAEIDQYYRGLV